VSNKLHISLKSSELQTACGLCLDMHYIRNSQLKASFDTYNYVHAMID